MQQQIQDRGRPFIHFILTQSVSTLELEPGLQQICKSDILIVFATFVFQKKLKDWQSQCWIMSAEDMEKHMRREVDAQQTNT